ncbi:sugar transferase [Mangrovimicrobium sediminis]|uniref:Sugar transferase n=1 Tax=Mangrovimicrobium sediminis TaxID=2562682 RepID=A0A4Z0M0J3_9GAMM|nr:sugar transferase [Haliea sp. SAOS-164]TGD73039.1 sugar transferase [Haliea sp. SAOS-164]
MRRNLAGRCLDLLVALPLALLTLPLLAPLSLAVLALSGRPVFHREQRLGRGGVPFTLYKLRSLAAGSGTQRGVAPADDARLTRPGSWLRRWRLDELPQLWQVVRGQMSLVGPRPLPPAHAGSIPNDQLTQLLSVAPGLTGAGALAFLAEDTVLAGRTDPEALYLRVLLPAKVEVELDYLRQRSLCGDLGLLARTAASVWSSAAHRRSRQRLETCLAQAGDA